MKRFRLTCKGKLAVKLMLGVLVFAFSFRAIAQRQPTLQEINRQALSLREEAEERILKYLEKNPQPRWKFLPNGGARLLVDVTPSGVPVYTKTFNDKVAENLNVKQLRTGGSLGINVLGTGMQIGVWDSGKILDTHVEFNGRVTNRENVALSEHSTHVTGTIIASGVNLLAKGMAPAATVVGYDFDNDISEMAGQANVLLLSNHSYGTQCGWENNGSSWTWNGDPAISSTIDYKFGFYDSRAAQWDGIAFNAPNYLIVKAAGNDRSDFGDGSKPADGVNGGYDCIPLYGVAKNILTVGAVSKLSSAYTSPSDVLMSVFSSFGPTDDGRIKPDLVAPGVGVLSSTSGSNTEYKTEEGTSMSTPAVTGALALLQQLYKNLNGGSVMRSATLKALALHTAREAGSSPGPDYRFGWGLLDAEAAAKVIINKDNQNVFIRENVLTSGQAFEMDLGTPKAGTKITATIVWTDPAGSPAAPSLNPTNKMLVNDLDLRLVDDGGTQELPWILNPTTPAAAATKGDNIRDNVEKIEFSNPLLRNYKLRVTNKGSLQGGTQAFSLILTYSSQTDPLTTYYWIGDGGVWNNGAHWSLTSGGAAANVVPTATDRVVFDENSFSADNATVSLSGPQSCFSLRWFAKEITNFSLGSNTLSIGEGATFVTDKVITPTAGTISFTSAAANANPVDLNANVLDKLTLNFNGTSTWSVTGSATLDKIVLTQGTVAFNNSSLHLNQLTSTGVNPKTVSFTASSLQAFSGLAVDLTGITVQSDISSSIIISAAVANTLTIGSSNFQGIVNMQSGDVSINGTGQIRSIQGNGIVRLNGGMLISNLTLSGGSQLILQAGSTHTFTDKIVFSTSASSRVAIKSTGANATFALNDYYKICVDNIDVTNVDVTGTSVVNAGAGSTLTNSQNWLKVNCSSILFPDFSVSFTCVKSSVYFTDKSSGPITSRSWSFGDPASTENTSSLISPVHYYTTAGPFTATLTLTGASGTKPVSKTFSLAPNSLADNSVQINNGKLISTVIAQGYQWLKGGQIISGATARSYSYGGDAGDYSVLIFDNTCNKRSTALITGVEDQPASVIPGFKIYPNPTSSFLQIEGSPAITSAAIMDAVGREIRMELEHLDEGRYRINVSSIPTGLYILKIVAQGKVTLQKIIIQK